MKIRDLKLKLRAGPAVPFPVPAAIVEALDSVQINEGSGDTQSGFDLSFRVEKGSPLMTHFLISSGQMPPVMRVILTAVLGARETVLIDGVVTHQQLEPGADGGPSTLKIQGKDLSQLLDLIPFDGIPYPATPPFARVNLILAKYAWLGIVPKVVPGPYVNTELPIEKIPKHAGRDLQYIRCLAGEAGYVFYMEPGPTPGLCTAYWGPETRVGRPQPALNVDMDAHTNVESLSFAFDKEQKEMPIVHIQPKALKAPIPIPILDSMIAPIRPPLGVIPPAPPKLTPLRDAAQLPPAAAITKGIGYAMQHSDALTGNGSLDVLRYGGILRSRRLVGVRGAGLPFNGLYYVKQVTHKIRRGEYKQDFTLGRGRLISTLPRMIS